MRNKLLPTFLAAAAVTVAFPAHALAASVVSFSTTLEPTGPTMQLGNSFGSLKLDVSPDGIVQGWYEPQYGDFVPVQGSLKDGAYRLEIGSNGNFQVYATRLADGSLTGTATNLAPNHGLYPPTYNFVAAPVKS